MWRSVKIFPHADFRGFLCRNSSLMGSVHRVVIVGGGAGGLELAGALGRRLNRKKQGRVMLVSAFPTHIWKPKLHELASGLMNMGEDEVNYFAHAYVNKYRFDLGRMDSLDRVKRLVNLAPFRSSDNPELVYVKERSIRYDTLVLAIGAQTNDFGIPGVREHCFVLNNPNDAEILRRRLLGHTMSVVSGNAATKKLRIGIVGGGATGVELASEIHHTIAKLFQYGSQLDPANLEVTLIEAAGRILLMGTEQLSAYALGHLRQRNIKVLLNTTIKSVTPTGFVMGDGSELPIEIKIWTAGNRGGDVVKDLGLPLNRSCQIIVAPDTLATEDPNILAIGDCCACPCGDQFHFLPATAQVASSQAEWMAKALLSKIEGTKHPGPYQFKPKGVVVSLGKKQAVGNVQAFAGSAQSYGVQGIGAKLLYKFLYRRHQAKLHGWIKTFFLILGDFVKIFTRPPLKFN